jgi:hypothetical protein
LRRLEGEAVSATEVVENLMKAGTTIKDGWSKAKQRDATMTWTKFMDSAEFTGAFGQASSAIDALTQPAVTKALVDIRTKQGALLAGKSVMELPTDKLAQYDALLDVENQLMRKFATNTGRTEEWVSWLVDDALPVLIKVAKVVLPLLL